MGKKSMRRVCVVLPSKQHVDCTVGVRATGQQVMGLVLKELDVHDLQVFGLAVLRDNEYLFVDLDRRLSKYFCKRWTSESTADCHILFLRIKFYVKSGFLIPCSKVRHLYFTELRQKLLLLPSSHQEALFFQLAALALQAEVGDQDEEEERKEANQQRNSASYFLPEDYFPIWLIHRRGRDFILQHCPILHAELRGLPRSRAILDFIRESGAVLDAGVTFYRMRKDKRKLGHWVHFGVAMTGVQINQKAKGKPPTFLELTWNNIERLTFRGSRFEISTAGSLSLPELVFYSPSAFHCEHILMHLRASHRMHMSSREAARSIQMLEEAEDICSHQEAYVCDHAALKQRLQALLSSMSHCSAAEEDDEEEWASASVNGDVDFWTDEEEEERFVDDPADVPWLSEVLLGASVDDGPVVLPYSLWAAVTVEMKQLLWRRADEGESVDKVTSGGWTRLSEQDDT